MSASSGSEREPEELLDPITLTLLEQAVMAPCGHSFSKASITSWLATAPHAVCPVCKAALSTAQLAPNWGLRNAVDRYEIKHGKKKDKDHQRPAQDESHDMPQPSAPAADQIVAFDDTAKPARPALPQEVGGTAQAPAQAVVPPAQEESFLCIDIPASENSCCCWACTDCGMCVNAKKCGKGNAWLFPFTVLICCTSFGEWSNWYSRTLCGVLFPVFFALLLAFMLTDLIYLTTLLLLFSVLLATTPVCYMIALPFYWCCCPSAVGKREAEVGAVEAAVDDDNQ